MLSRRHIRVKVMQLLFAHHDDPLRAVPGTQEAEHRVDRTMDAVYSLYLYLLDYARQLIQFARQFDEEQAGRYIQDQDRMRAHAKLYENPLFGRLEESQQLERALERYQARFRGDRDLLRKIFQDLRQDEEYLAYHRLEDDTRLLHMDMIYYLINHYSRDYELLTQHLEEVFPNWWDDYRLVMKMIRKTLRGLVYEEAPRAHILEPMASEPEAIREFGARLLRKTIQHQQELDQLVRSKLTHTDADAIPRVDHILMRMGVCEFLHFPTIPTTATINEYVDIAKLYSIPSSKKMINAVLQSVLNALQQQDRVHKSDRSNS